jgi:hypothetical protein
MSDTVKFEFDKKFLDEEGITDPVAFLKDLIAYERYVNNHYDNIGDEAWSHVTSLSDE